MAGAFLAERSGGPAARSHLPSMPLFPLLIPKTPSLPTSCKSYRSVYPTPSRTYIGATPFWEVRCAKTSQLCHPFPEPGPRFWTLGGAKAAAEDAYPGFLMTAIVAPEVIGSPSLTATCSTTPALWAVISFSIFIASMMQTSSPSWTS